MTTRYTYKSLEAECSYLNDQMKADGIEWVLVPGGRYGYSAVDIATPEAAARHCVNRTLETGSPRECAAEARKFVNEQYRNRK